MSAIRLILPLLVLFVLSANCDRQEAKGSKQTGSPSKQNETPQRGSSPSHTTQKHKNPKASDDVHLRAAKLPETAPRVRMRISGHMEGRLTPCGCASGQLGGLPRRAFELKADPSYDLLIEGGELVIDHTEFDLWKIDTTLQVLKMAGYRFVGVGPDDLRFDSQRLPMHLEASDMAVVASDLESTETGPNKATAVYVPFFEQGKGAKKTRIASLVTSLPKDGMAKLFNILTPAKAWQRAMQGAAPSTFRVLMTHGSTETLGDLAKLQPKPDLLVSVTHEQHEPPTRPTYVGGVPVVFSGTRGRMLVDATLARDDQGPLLLDYKVILLRGSETSPGAREDAGAKERIMDFRNMVKDLGLRNELARRFDTKTGAKFVGSIACKECHESAYADWKRSKHSGAWETLERAEVKKYKWPVTHFPDCVKCHTVGYYQKTGFVAPDLTPHLKGVGCEECHGPGSRHIKSKSKADIDRSSAAKCTQCHDFEQSPNFDYNKRWAIIRHK